MKKTIYIICGHSDDGKTSWISQALDYFNSNNIDFYGVVCPSEFIKNEKAAIDCVLLPSNKRFCLAKRKPDFSEGYSRKWKFDDKIIDAINAHIDKATSCDYFICDEIGPLELIKKQGFTSALSFLKEGQYNKALVALRPLLVDKFKLMYSDVADIKIIDVCEQVEFCPNIIDA